MVSSVSHCPPSNCRHCLTQTTTSVFARLLSSYFVGKPVCLSPPRIIALGHCSSCLFIFKRVSTRLSLWAALMKNRYLSGCQHLWASGGCVRFFHMLLRSSLLIKRQRDKETSSDINHPIKKKRRKQNETFGSFSFFTAATQKINPAARQAKYIFLSNVAPFRSKQTCPPPVNNLLLGNITINK